MKAGIPVGLIALVGGCLSGCSSTFNGVLEDSGQPVEFSRYAGLCLDTVMVTLPDGETFAGYLDPVGEPDEFCRVGWRAAAAGQDSALYGTRINMMTCDLHSMQANTGSGDPGRCILSDGRTIVLKGKQAD